MTLLLLFVVPLMFFVLGYQAPRGTLWRYGGIGAVVVVIGVSAAFSLGKLLPILAAMPYLQGLAVALAANKLRARAK